MNNLDKQLFERVCNNDIAGAKKILKIILEKDHTQANRAFCNRLLIRLNNSAMNLMELPADIKSLLIMEDVSVSFNENRYYLSQREQEIAEKIISMNRVAGRLADIGVNYVNSTMLYGESGTGKTTFGRYLAHKMGLPFAYLNFSRTVDSYLGSTQKNISKVFDYIKQQKCVFMLDEVDAIGMKRGKEDVGEMSRIVISLMQNLDTLTSDITLLGATNRLDIIDEALLRRFTTKHEVKRLGVNERREMAEKFFGDVEYEISPIELRELAMVHDTQAGLMNRIVMVMVRHYTENEDLKE